MPVYRAETKFSTKKAGYSALSCVTAINYRLFRMLTEFCRMRLCIFHDENHDLSRSGKPKNRIKRLSEITKWFEKYLK